MPVASPIVVIVNPQAANGRTARVWKTLRPRAEAVLGALRVLETHAPGHATELTRAALDQGCRTLIAVGGDGTLNEVVNGFFANDKPVAADAGLGLIPQGSSSDFRRTLAIPLEEAAALEVIRRGATRKLDVMDVRFQTVDGLTARRFGLNITSFGMGGAVAARANRSSKVLGGRLSFQLATVLTTLGFRGRSVRLQLDDQEPREVTISHIAAGNGQYHGAGMQVCPQAVVDDGRLDVTVIRYLSPFEVLRSFPILYNGRIYEHPKVELQRATRLAATADELTLIEIDGEAVGRLPVEISVLPRALTFYVPKR